MERDPNRPKVPEVAPLVAAYMKKHPAGGPLHIVLSDGNYRDSDVTFCIERAMHEGDREGAEIAALLLRMTKSQRARVAHSR